MIEEQGRVMKVQGRAIKDLQRAKVGQGHVIEKQGRVILNLQSNMAKHGKFQNCVRYSIISTTASGYLKVIIPSH